MKRELTETEIKRAKSNLPKGSEITNSWAEVSKISKCGNYAYENLVITFKHLGQDFRTRFSHHGGVRRGKIK